MRGLYEVRVDNYDWKKLCKRHITLNVISFVTYHFLVQAFFSI